MRSKKNNKQKNLKALKRKQERKDKVTKNSILYVITVHYMSPYHFVFANHPYFSHITTSQLYFAVWAFSFLQLFKVLINSIKPKFLLLPLLLGPFSLHSYIFVLQFHPHLFTSKCITFALATFVNIHSFLAILLLYLLFIKYSNPFHCIHLFNIFPEIPNTHPQITKWAEACYSTQPRSGLFRSISSKHFLPAFAYIKIPPSIFPSSIFYQDTETHLLSLDFYYLCINFIFHLLYLLCQT